MILNSLALPMTLSRTLPAFWKVDGALQSYLAFCSAELARPPPSVARPDLAAWLLTALTRRFGQTSDERIRVVCRWLDEHFAHPVTLDRLCEVACLGRSRLKERFKEETGQGIRDYLLQRRMVAARRLLEDGRRSVKQAAAAAGYADESAFARRFRLFWGQTPAAYQRSAVRRAN